MSSLCGGIQDLDFGSLPRLPQGAYSTYSNFDYQWTQETNNLLRNTAASNSQPQLRNPQSLEELVCQNMNEGCLGLPPDLGLLFPNVLEDLDILEAEQFAVPQTSFSEVPQAEPTSQPLGNLLHSLPQDGMAIINWVGLAPNLKGAANIEQQTSSDPHAATPESFENAMQVCTNNSFQHDGRLTHSLDVRRPEVSPCDNMNVSAVDVARGSECILATDLCLDNVQRNASVDKFDLTTDCILPHPPTDQPGTSSGAGSEAPQATTRSINTAAQGPGVLPAFCDLIDLTTAKSVQSESMARDSPLVQGSLQHMPNSATNDTQPTYSAPWQLPVPAFTAPSHQFLGPQRFSLDSSQDELIQAPPWMPAAHTNLGSLWDQGPGGLPGLFRPQHARHQASSLHPEQCSQFFPVQQLPPASRRTNSINWCPGGMEDAWMAEVPCGRVATLMDADFMSRAHSAPPVLTQPASDVLADQAQMELSAAASAIDTLLGPVGHSSFGHFQATARQLPARPSRHARQPPTERAIAGAASALAHWDRAQRQAEMDIGRCAQGREGHLTAIHSPCATSSPVDASLLASDQALAGAMGLLQGGTAPTAAARAPRRNSHLARDASARPGLSDWRPDLASGWAGTGGQPPAADGQLSPSGSSCSASDSITSCDGLEGEAAGRVQQGGGVECPRSVEGSSNGQEATRPGRKSNITLERLRTVFELPIDDAAKKLGLGATVLKKYCRKYKIPRWPYRKLKSMDRLIQGVEEHSCNNDPDAQELLDELRGFRRQILLEPATCLAGYIKRLRQANFKIEYKLRKALAELVKS